MTERQPGAPGTLEVTEDRQYRLHISDEAFECFKTLKNLRVQQMNLSRLTGSNMKASFAENAVHVIQSEATLSSSWKAAFKDIEPDKEVSTSFVYLQK